MFPPALRRAFLLAARYQVKLIGGGALTHPSSLVIGFSKASSFWSVSLHGGCAEPSEGLCVPFSVEYVLQDSFSSGPYLGIESFHLGVEAFPGKPPPTISALRFARVPSVQGCLVNLE